MYPRLKRVMKKKTKKSFRDYLKALEADIQHANTLASCNPRENDGAYIQMRLSYSPYAQIFLYFRRWTDCQLASVLGLVKILIYKVYEDGKTTMSIHERKASLKQFYGVIFPSILQLQKGITEVEEKKQSEILAKYKRKRDETEKGNLSETEIESDEECEICNEICTKVVLPNCAHSMCLRCYKSWRDRSQSCPFCRDCLKRVDSGDLWVFTSGDDVADTSEIERENLKRLFLYTEKLPLIVPRRLVSYDPLFRYL